MCVILPEGYPSLKYYWFSLLKCKLVQQEGGGPRGILILNLVSGPLCTDIFYPEPKNHDIVPSATAICAGSMCFDEPLQERGNEISVCVVVNTKSKQSTDSFPEYKQGKENVSSDPMLYLILSLQTVHEILQRL